MDKLLDQLLEHSFNKGCSFLGEVNGQVLKLIRDIKGRIIDLDSNITWLFTIILFLEKNKVIININMARL